MPRDHHDDARDLGDRLLLRMKREGGNGTLGSFTIKGATLWIGAVVAGFSLFAVGAEALGYLGFGRTIMAIADQIFQHGGAQMAMAPLLPNGHLGGALQAVSHLRFG